MIQWYAWFLYDLLPDIVGCLPVLVPRTVLQTFRTCHSLLEMGSQQAATGGLDWWMKVVSSLAVFVTFVHYIYIYIYIYIFVCSSMFLPIRVSRNQSEAPLPWWDLRLLASCDGCMDRTYDNQKRILNSEKWSYVLVINQWGILKCKSCNEVKGTLCKRVSGNPSAQIAATCTLSYFIQCQESLKEE